MTEFKSAHPARTSCVLDFLSDCVSGTHSLNPVNPVVRCYFGASEATIFSKRGDRREAGFTTGVNAIARRKLGRGVAEPVSIV
jgi:hypothetical protein